MKANNERTSRGYSVYARGGQWILVFKDESATAKKKWREHRIPKSEASTEKQAERYAERVVAELRRIRSEDATRPPTQQPSVHGPSIRDLADKWLDLRD